MTTTATMSYNANGNLTQKTESSTTGQYTWDYETRMTQAANGTATAQYSYDALGRRIRRVVAATGEDTKFIYDGLDVVMDEDVTAGVTKYQNGLGIDDKLSLKNGGVSKYFLADHLGSTVALTDSSGAVTEAASYDSFGNATTNLSTRYQYTGREYDLFSGFYYYRARWYDAKLGRFVSEDPIGFRGGDINYYGYVRNNPTKSTDPFGLYPWGRADFYWHYLTGAGAAVDLANVGLLGVFQGSPSVIEATSGFKTMVIDEVKKRAASECDKNCAVQPKSKRSTYFRMSDRTTTNVTKEIFEVGNSTFFREAMCFIDVDCTSRRVSFKCSLTFSIRDRYTDPFDGRSVGFPFDLPAHQPYSINARWTENFNGGCGF
jgi:RHS repeat-associated protein